MTIRNQFGLIHSGAHQDSLETYERALRQLLCYIEDPITTVNNAIAESPEFTMAHILKAYLHLLGTEPGDIAIANTCLKATLRLGGDSRERMHQQAVRHLIEGRWHQAGRVLEDITIDNPHDILALQAGHLVDFYTGNSLMLRDRIARAFPKWNSNMPEYHAILGMYAFGLEETGLYDLAERHGRESVALNPRDGWGQHAVAHVMEMQGRAAEGVAWMRENPDAWATDSFFQVHNWWHLALYHLELGEIDEVLALFDGPIYGEQSTMVLDMIDVSAMLWRLHLRGIELGDRWQAIADGWTPIATAGNYAFNDLHAVMAFIGANRQDSIDAVIDTQKIAMEQDDDNALFTREVGYPLTLAFKAYADEDYQRTVELIRPVREIANRFGGSHAQRDILNLTLIEAALRAGDANLANALIAERMEKRPDSPLLRLFNQRAHDMRKAA
ncbi:MAG: tetratricopeptide repeat protein [Candidatus Thiodiazotropha endolucinida]